MAGPRHSRLWAPTLAFIAGWTVRIQAHFPRMSEWYSAGMRTTIDMAGRVVIPKSLRDELGFLPGEVELVRDGAGVRIEPVSTDTLVDEAGRTVIPASGTPIDDGLVQALRDAGQR